MNPFQQNSDSEDTSSHKKTSSEKEENGLANYNPFANDQQNHQDSNQYKDNQRDNDGFDPDMDFNQDVENNQNTSANPFKSQAAMTNTSNMTLEELEYYTQKRETELDAREKKLGKIEQNLGVDPQRYKNWPVCRPILFHSIKKDIPSGSQGYVRLAYLTWIITYCAFGWNMICMFAKLSGGEEVTNKGADVGLSILYVIVVPVLCWPLWYRLLYNAARKSKTRKFSIFFCTFILFLMFVVVIMIGVSGTGCAGVLNLLACLDKNAKTAAYLMIPNIVVWFLILIFGVIILKQAITKYRELKPKKEEENQEKTKNN
ncbi:secretory carrier-associated membrane protein [Anaeramoeba ignava]|uniref:Secretory carrier-associated membrane protein n=1 Tax=Anaeramoeba ignava TaxID=1746090 RepID=A0A9Q0R757_ANAIG|nr:secretory carrier-associated membrane protein [Anaeramoeba ignava]